jgi:hypothetical protein
VSLPRRVFRCALPQSSSRVFAASSAARCHSRGRMCQRAVPVRPRGRVSACALRESVVWGFTLALRSCVSLQATGLVDFEQLSERAALFKPALIICGGSAYPREWDYSKFREIADANGALLMCDMAHISGLVATGEAANPFEVCCRAVASVAAARVACDCGCCSAVCFVYGSLALRSMITSSCSRCSSVTL